MHEQQKVKTIIQNKDSMKRKSSDNVNTDKQREKIIKQEQENIELNSQIKTLKAENKRINVDLTTLRVYMEQ